MGWDMKNTGFTLVVFVLFICSGSIFCDNASRESLATLATLASSAQSIDNPQLKELVEEAEKTVKTLHSDVMWENDSLHKERERRLKNIETEIKQQLALGRKQTELNEKALQEKASRAADLLIKQAKEQTRAIQENFAGVAAELSRKAQEQAKKIEKEFAQQALEEQRGRLEKERKIIDKVEEVALKIKQEERKKLFEKEAAQLAKRKIAPEQRPVIEVQAQASPRVLLRKKKTVSSGVPVTDEWRDTIAQSFRRDIKFIQDIIVEGESPEQAGEFAQVFNEQAMWFDSTLRSTQCFHDACYSEVIQKKSVIDKLALAQKKANDIVAHFSRKAGLSKREQEKLSLFVLYDLHGVISKSAPAVDGEQEFIPLDDKVVRESVARVADDVLGSLLKDRGLIVDVVMKDIEPVDREVFDDLQKEMEEIKIVLKDEVAKYKALKEQRKNIDQANMKELLELEVQLRESKVLIAYYQRQLKQTQVAQVNATFTRNSLVKQLEACMKENFENELKLSAAAREVKRVEQIAQTTQRAFLGQLKPELETRERQSLEAEVAVKASKQKAKALENRLDRSRRQVALQKEAIAAQRKLYQELATRGMVLEELAEQRFDEHERKILKTNTTKNFVINDNMK